MNIKTRFAPSPTGNLHIGNIRTALFAWLFAKKHGGQFILRIEDTNTVKDSILNSDVVKGIISIMKWLNLNWDEGPYFQTDRLQRYNNIIDNMLNNNMAYKCYCSIDRLRLLRASQIKYGKKPKYDGYCRMNLISKFGDKNIFIKNHDVPHVVRFSNPRKGVVSFYDQIYGMINFNNEELDDVIIRRTNGMPTYNFCVVVDDMDMNITHIIRGEEHINNTPRQINILKALKASIPKYAHIPIILGFDRKKISKRYNQCDMRHYRDDGFLPEAIVNYLVRLGWSHGNQEIFNLQQMIEYFDFSKISKSSSIFDEKKLLWYNHYYINNLPADYIVSYLSKYIHRQKIMYKGSLKLSDMVSIFSKRVSTLKEMILNYFDLCKKFNVFEKKINTNYLTPDIIAPLKLLRNKISGIDDWTLRAVQLSIKEVLYELNLKMNVIGIPLRMVLIGTDKSPELSVVICIIGKFDVLKRIDRAIEYIQNLFIDEVNK